MRRGGGAVFDGCCYPNAYYASTDDSQLESTVLQIFETMDV